MQKILRKRIIRDLKENLFRYLALGVLIILGMYLIVSLVGAAETIIEQTASIAEKNHLEDGEFGVFVPLTASELDKLGEKGVDIEPICYLDFSQGKKGTLRVFKNRENIDLVELDDGNLAKKAGEVVLEKRYCEENEIHVGDKIKIAGTSYQVVGIGSTPDYDAPYRNLSDSSVESSQFGTAFVTADAYETLQRSGQSEKAEQYQYAYRLNGKMTDDVFKEKVKKLAFTPEEVENPYFTEYWDRTAGKKEDMENGIQDLFTGAEELNDALVELSAHNEDLTDGAGEIFDAFLKEANSGLLPYGLPKTLTEDNFEEVLEDMKADSDNALFRLKLNAVRDELKALKSYKDGVVSYTDAVGETADGSTELKDGISELKEQSDELFDTYFKVETNNLTFFLSADENPRIGAAADDQQINKFAGLVAGVIIMILFTYVISVFIIHGIEKESSVIGALYALGVTRKDLIFHYLSLPVMVTFLSGLIGTVIGFSKWGVPVQMQDCYNYFSVPQMPVVFPSYLLVYSLIMPSLVAVIVNCLVIWKHLSRPVLAMLKKEQKESRIKNLDLGNMGFVSRFRIRQMLREYRSGFAVILGMFISLLILMIGVDCYALCEHVRTGSIEDTKYEYMYTYKYPDETVPDGGEAAYAKTLKKEVLGYNLDVTVLGLEENNPYFDVTLPDEKNKVVLASAMAQKYGLKEGAVFVLQDGDTDMDYAFEVAGITKYTPGFYVFMDIEQMRELFGEDKEYYNVVFSDHALSIDAGKLYATTTRAEVEKASGVFTRMMMPMIYMMIGVSAFIFFVVMYLMMKVMIDRSSYGISLLMVFGYRSKELKKLYLNGNFYMIAVGAAICLPVSKIVMNAMYPYLVSNVACGLDLGLSWQIYAGIYVAILVLYFIINYLLVRRLGKIVPAEFLKNRE